MEYRASSVNRFMPDIFPEEDVPVFSAFIASTSSETAVTWSRDADTGSTSAGDDPCNGIIRWYDPITGRWLSNDPIGISGGLNQYVFCEDNPVNFTDVWGLVKDKIDGHIITVHKADVDPWPSQPHGHIYDKNLVVDKTGSIFNKANRQRIGQIGKKALPRLLSLFDRVLGVFEFVIIPPEFLPRDPRPATLPYVPGDAVPPGYIPRYDNSNGGDCNGSPPVEYVRWDLFA